MSVTSPVDTDAFIPNLQMTRLHITPFNPSLLNVIVPPSILPSAQNISYHSLQTFPEKSYGFLELPTMDAEKIKKKLNGSILKGSKVRIEEARPSKEAARSLDLGETIPKEKKEKLGKSSRKRKRYDEILPGVELRDRKVQRGWTTPSTESKKSDKRQKDKKDKKAAPVKSKFTPGSECLFKTSLPPNVAANLKENSGVALVGGKRKKSGREAVVIHEFFKTTKHATFLRGSGISAGSPGVSNYVEGKGWVDKDGNVVEAEVPKRKRSTIAIHKNDAESSSEVSSTSEEENSSEDEVEDSIMKTPAPVTRDASVTSSSGSSSEEDEDKMEKDEEVDLTSSSASDSSSSASASPTSQPSEQHSRPGTATSIPPTLSLQIPKIETTPVQVHPLEALYKKTNASTATPSFSFFNNDDNADIDNSQPDTRGLTIPMTPFTQQEFEFRGLRSAAPTPDTAHPGKTYAVWPNASTSSSKLNTKLNSQECQEEQDEEEEENDDDDDDDEEEEYTKSPIPNRSTPTPSTNKEKTTEEKSSEVPTSDFQKWFYENRGEANRAWKKRRKVVGKEKRYKENKKRGDRAI